MRVLPIRSSVRTFCFAVSALLEGVCLLNWNICLAGFGSCFKNLMLLAKKSLMSYVGLYQKFLYKSFSLLLKPPPPNQSSHAFPNATIDASGTRSTVFCAPQKYVPAWSCQWEFSKHYADAAIGRSPCVTSILSDTLRNFRQSRFLLFYDHSQGDLLFCQEVHGCLLGGASWGPLWQRSCPSSTRDSNFDRPTICPRGPYWSWCFQHLQSGRRHCPCHESGAGVWWWNGTIPRECSFGWHSYCWHTLWGTDMGVGWHWLPCCGST